MHSSRNQALRVHVIPIHAAAPAKPALGVDCNGCGLCCASEPCPVSRLWLGHRTGACPALQWSAGEARYRCGMAITPQRHVRWLPDPAGPLAARVFRRWIAAGIGCDFDADIVDG